MAVLPSVLPRIPKGQPLLRSTTLRGFTGGLNVIDDDMNMKYVYSTVAQNVFITADGIAQARYGTTLFARTDLGVGVVNMEYFNTAIIAVLTNGNIVMVDASGNSSVIDASKWGATSFASFAQFNGQLIICNGTDKPLYVNKLFVVDYLQDLATMTNINTPVCKYVVANGRYLVMAGDAINPERVHISARDAGGTWFGDPDPNDATHVDVGSSLSSASTLRGLLSFRDKLLVLYAEGIVVGTLGVYDDDGNHTPNFNDAIEQYGSVSHRSAIARGDDGLFMDLEGVSSIKRTVLSTQLKPERASSLIDPLITEMLKDLSFGTLEDNVFAVYDHKEGQYMLFIPNSDSGVTETKGFVYSYRPVLKQDGWSQFLGWNWTCGCRSLQGNIFFGDANGDIWLYGSRDYPSYADFIISNQAPADNSEGQPIEFVWELPWLDFDQRDKVKNNKHISFDTRGTAEFTFEMFVDNITASQMSGSFSAGEQGAFGEGDQPYGGGRITSYKKLYAWPCKFEIAKYKFSGSITEPWAMVAITNKYQLGGINR